MLEAFWDYIKQTDDDFKRYVSQSGLVRNFRPGHLRESVMAYLLRPAKRLRPAVLKLACGCLGGEPRMQHIIPVAAAIELFHTWTLVHDDIIDNDSLRRGEKTVHVLARDLGGAELNLDQPISEEYGRAMAILAGDIQHGWVTAAFLEPALQNAIAPELIITLLHRLETHVLAGLIEGEVLDVQFSLTDEKLSGEIDEEMILKMEWLKTGLLIEFAAQAGAMIGKGVTDFEDPQVRNLADFAVNCGLAFQIQDDILGITGDEKQLGKPIGSDIREGKKTIIVLRALNNADESGREELAATLGNRAADDNQVKKVIRLLQDLGGIDYARQKAKNRIEQAMDSLTTIPGSFYRDLLESWAEFMINRDL